MALTIREAARNEIDALTPLLLLAEPSAPALRWSLEHLSDTLFCIEDDGVLVGAASVRLATEPAEIVELAIDPTRQRQGLGRQLLAHIAAVARTRGRRLLEVGTSNASLGNLGFYQRCGYRLDRVRRDYFRYYRRPRLEHGIEVRDLVVLQLELQKSSA